MAEATLYFPINTARIADDDLTKELDRFIDEVSRLEIKLKGADNSYGTDLTIRFSFSDTIDVKIPEPIQEFLLKGSPDGTTYLVSTLESKPYEDYLELIREFGLSPERGFILSKEFFCGLIVERCYYHIMNLIISSHISSPGLIETHDAIAAFDGNFVNRFEPMFTDITQSNCIDAYRSLKSDARISFLDALNWYEATIDTENLQKKSPASKACCALTFLFCESVDIHDPARLFWAISGVEAIFSDGRPGYVKDITAKLDALGLDANSNAALRKSFDKMYKVRHGLVHGNYILTPRIQYGGHESIQIDQGIDIDKAIALSSAILLVGLQKLCSMNAQHLDFEYKLSNSIVGLSK